MRYRPGALAVVGSNPTGPIERSVQIPKLAGKTNDGIGTTIHRRLKIPSDPSSNVTHGMRDLYHRQQRLAYWIKRVNTDLEEPDRIDVLKLVEHMQDRERSTKQQICVIL